MRAAVLLGIPHEIPAGIFHTRSRETFLGVPFFFWALSRGLVSVDEGHEG